MSYDKPIMQTVGYIRTVPVESDADRVVALMSDEVLGHAVGLLTDLLTVKGTTYFDDVFGTVDGTGENEERAVSGLMTMASRLFISNPEVRKEFPEMTEDFVSEVLAHMMLHVANVAASRGDACFAFLDAADAKHAAPGSAQVH